MRQTTYARAKQKSAEAIARKAKREAKHGKPPPRKRMKPVSDKKAKWNRLYITALNKAKLDQYNEEEIYWCEKCMMKKSEVEGHHTQGRIGANILIFKLVCTPCHRFIHENGKQARAEGWLT